MNVDDLEPFLGIRGYWQHPNVQAFLQRQLAPQLDERRDAARDSIRAIALLEVREEVRQQVREEVRLEGRADEARAMILRQGTAKFGKPTK